MEKRFKTLKRISTLKGVVLHYNYVITKETYKLLKTLKHNRGGEDVNRWKYYVKAYKDGKFNFDLASIKVGVDGTVYEGNNKVIALIYVGEEIPITIVPKQKIEDVAEFNSSPSSKWKPDQQFQTSISMRSKTAILMNVLRIKAMNSFHLTEKQLSASEMYGLLVKDTKHFSSGKFAPTLRQYNNTELAKDAASNEYDELVMKYAEIKYQLRQFTRRYKIAKAVIEFYFDKTQNFDIDIFIEGLKTQVLVIPEKNPNNFNYKETEEIKKGIMKLYNKELKYHKAA